MRRSSRAWRVGRDEAVISYIIRVISSNLSGIVDAEGKRVNTRWWIDARVLPVAVNKGVLSVGSATGLIIAGDLSFIVDA